MMLAKKIRTQKGYAMVLSMVAMSVASLGVLSLVNVGSSNMKIDADSLSATQSFYLAEAALSQASANIKDDFSAVTVTGEGQIFTLGSGEYRYSVEDTGDPFRKRIVGEGAIPNFDNPEITRRVEMFVKGEYELFKKSINSADDVHFNTQDYFVDGDLFAGDDFNGDFGCVGNPGECSNITGKASFDNDPNFIFPEVDWEGLKEVSIAQGNYYYGDQPDTSELPTSFYYTEPTDTDPGVPNIVFTENMNFELNNASIGGVVMSAGEGLECPYCHPEGRGGYHVGQVILNDNASVDGFVIAMWDFKKNGPNASEDFVNVNGGIITWDDVHINGELNISNNEEYMAALYNLQNSMVLDDPDSLSVVSWNEILDDDFEFVIDDGTSPNDEEDPYEAVDPDQIPEEEYMPGHESPTDEPLQEPDVEEYDSIDPVDDADPLTGGPSVPDNDYDDYEEENDVPQSTNPAECSAGICPDMSSFPTPFDSDDVWDAKVLPYDMDNPGYDPQVYDPNDHSEDRQHYYDDSHFDYSYDQGDYNPYGDYGNPTDFSDSPGTDLPYYHPTQGPDHHNRDRANNPDRPDLSDVFDPATHNGFGPPGSPTRDHRDGGPTLEDYVQDPARYAGQEDLIPGVREYLDEISQYQTPQDAYGSDRPTTGYYDSNGNFVNFDYDLGQPQDPVAAPSEAGLSDHEREVFTRYYQRYGVEGLDVAAEILSSEGQGSFTRVDETVARENRSVRSQNGQSSGTYCSASNGFYVKGEFVESSVGRGW